MAILTSFKKINQQILTLLPKHKQFNIAFTDLVYYAFPTEVAFSCFPLSLPKFNSIGFILFLICFNWFCNF